MAMCEDFPCCGHELNSCPTEDGPVCVGCQAQLSPDARYSLCEWCLRRPDEDDWDGGYGDDDVE
jgi:hypothetical protein